MLSLLHIENIAVIERADILFEPGFNVLTGETGAGKSIVIDAIGAVTGERASRDLVRTGENCASVSAVFCALPENPFFREIGAESDEDGNLLLQREIFADGRNVCRINGRPVTVSQLRALGSFLIQIHGQHEGLKLLNEQNHLGYLDLFGKTDKELSEYRARYEALAAIEGEIRALHMDEAEKARRTDLLRHQIAELERAELQAGEEEGLEARRNILRNAERITEAVETAHACLSGDEDTGGAASLLAEAERAFTPAARVNGEMAALSEKLTELRYLAQDAAEEIRDLKYGLEFSPEELNQLEGRLALLGKLKKKYGETSEQMLATLQKRRTELEEIEFADDTVRRLEEKREKAAALVKEAAEALSKVRRSAAEVLEGRILSELSQLDMPKVRFEAEFSAKEPGAAGWDEVRFLMSANVGEALRPMNKVASGGELARIMLAMKNALADGDGATLIFDEVDAGVSGRAAQRVAEKLFQVSRGRQVLCVTHLPQIAAMADSHFSVEKGEAGGRTQTGVSLLDKERRKEELARITGGAQITDITLSGAAELLEAAEAYKIRIEREAK
ncbi:DNA repair protein RecN [Papillibacter cinnamivorans]|uniref:DNA repair protein RecN n=1 Tax=Papillibacter cinnamivorans DSM 12816 TaxID=1122930 RepID=A0A1W2CJP4_9FIRM|nr:DNA repair protein RecN [Papillibacter cinnamivorans]SMC85410.1 DNA repair protein RecN (Recombination protein N) [Papillibacter cinnamivorans DSM 12816]